MKKMLILSALLLIPAFAILIATQNPEEKPAGNLVPVTQDAFGAPFTLTSHEGEKFRSSDLSGQYQLIYFGFTYCPAICPTELQKITATLNALNPEIAAQIQPVFITVDPERDTVKVMRDYLTLFHPSFLGLTGTQEEITQVLNDYKVYAAKVDDPSLTEYTMDHSSYIYFIDPEGRLLRLYKMEDTADYMVRDMTDWFKART